MGGAGVLRQDDHPQDYRLWGNREYLRDDSETHWVKLWVSWYELQEGFKPRSQTDSWKQLNSAPNGQNYLKRLDRQVKAANDDGAGVIICLQQAFPTWSSGATGTDPNSSKAASQKVPNDLSPNGPWAWFISHLSARYNGTYNSSGPRDPNRKDSRSFGNPDKALAHAIEVSNEPNTLYWPQENIHKRAAQMIRTGEELSFQWGRQTIVGPATLDSPDPVSTRPLVSTDWKTFTEGVLAELADFRPRVMVSWSMHNYRDLAREESGATSRAKQVIDLLYANNWKGGGDRNLWLTEGGYNMGTNWTNPTTRDLQASRIAKNFEEMRLLPDVFLWTQHVINDVTGNSFRSGLRDDFIYSPAGPGPKRPSWDTWRQAPGADTR